MSDQECEHEQLYMEVNVKLYLPIKHSSAKEVSAAVRSVERWLSFSDGIFLSEILAEHPIYTAEQLALHHKTRHYTKILANSTLANVAFREIVSAALDSLCENSKEDLAEMYLDSMEPEEVAHLAAHWDLIDEEETD